MGYIAISDNDKYKTCMNCLGELNGGISKNINGLGYGSNFDNLSTRIQLCESCYQENPNIWGFKEVDISSSMGLNDGELFAYEFEDEIIDYIDNMPLAGQELFWNRFASRGLYEVMNPQDWIDYKLNILPHDKCKEYGLYSPDEIKAYKERFPVCKHVYTEKHSDGSSSTKCIKGVYGNLDSNDGFYIDDKCYNCSIFAIKETNSDKYTKDIFNIAKDTGNNPAEVELVLNLVAVSIHETKGRPVEWGIMKDIIGSLDYETKRNLVLLYNII